MEPVLKITNIKKAFGALRAVNGISATLGPGEVLGIAGPNGSGKSTLLNSITGIPFGPDSGEIFLDGVNIGSLRAHARFKAGLARTFQTETCFEALSVRGNIRVASRYGGGKGSRGDSRRAMRAVRLKEDSMERVAAELSVFDKKKLMLCTAIVNEPKVLLLDEPAAGLSRNEVDEFKSVISDIVSEGVAIVLVEHVMPLLLSISDRILVMNQGEEVMTGYPDEVIRDQRVIKAYLGGAVLEG